jgi:hypothetical protein
MSNLSDMTKEAVRREFPDLRVSFGEPPDPIVTIAPMHPDFGTIEVIDEEVELTVNCGNFTHGHLSNYDEGISTDERDKRIVASLVTFLSDVFADRVEFWGSHRGGGGCRLRGSQGRVSRLVIGGATFTWSGPIKNGRTG